MNAKLFHRRQKQGGQVMILFALAMIVILGMMAIGLDGGYGFVQNRRAQNAADFAAFAAAQELNASTLCNGTATPPSNTRLAQIVQDVVDANAPAVGSSGSSWTGQFLDGSGAKIAGATFTPTSNSGTPPPGSCGLYVVTKPVWQTFLAGLIGNPQLTGNATARVGSTNNGKDVSIASLNKVGPHTILGGGTGNFVVSGDIYLDTNVKYQPWTGLHNGLWYDDAIDAKSNSNLSVYGVIHSSNAKYKNTNDQLWPLDWCFGGIWGGGDLPVKNDNPSPQQPYNTALSPRPTNNPPCSVGSVQLYYNYIDNSLTPIDDPLQASGAPTNPYTSGNAIACPGSGGTPLTNPTIPPYGAGATMKPGIYTSPVHITGTMKFGDCSALGLAAYPGIYRFTKGLWIDPRLSTDTVTGDNVLLTTSAPYPVAGNVPGSGTSPFVQTPNTPGNGGRCLPAGTKGPGGAEVDATKPASQCGGTSPQLYGAFINQDSWPGTFSAYGTGTNFSVMIGGVTGSQVTLTGPTTGIYGQGIGNPPGLILYQDFNNQANFGFNAQPGDAATIDITGVVYDASLTNYGLNASDTYSVGDLGPAYSGGILQTGFGAGWVAPVPAGITPSAGSVKITGTSVVDDFNTDGTTIITIIGKPYKLPGGGVLSLIG
jgi:hypothetical protein